MRKKLFIIIIFLLLCLCGGCSQRNITLDTTLHLNENGSGERVMQFEISKADYNSYFGSDIHALNEVAGNGCPNYMKMDFSEEGGNYTYSFKIAFSSIEDYKKKVSEILGKKVTISFEESSAVFEVGLNYNEDFSSIDLMQWLKKLMVEKGYFSDSDVESLFTSGDSKVIYQNKTYDCEEENLSVSTLVKAPLLGIDVLTTFRNSNLYDRKYVFKFSHNAVDSSGEEFKSYMEKILGSQIQAKWEDRTEAVLCTIELKKATSTKQEELLKKLFNSDSSRIYVEDVKAKEAGYFSFENKWSETIDINNLVENKEDTIPLAYYVQAENGVDLKAYIPNERGNYKLKDTDDYGGYQIVYKGDINHWGIECNAKRTYSVKTIDVETKVKNSDKLNRTITFHFENNPSKKEQNQIKERMEALSEKMASVETKLQDEKFQVTISLAGEIKAVNKNFKTIFGKEGSLEVKEKGKLTQWKHECSYADKVDFSSFLKNEENKTTLNYTLILNSHEKIYEESISSTVNLKNGTQKIDGNKYICSVNGFYLNLTFSSQKTNMSLSIIVRIIILLGLFAFAMAVIVKFLKKLMIYRQGFEEVEEEIEEEQSEKEDESWKMDQKLEEEIKKFIKKDE